MPALFYIAGTNGIPMKTQIRLLLAAFLLLPAASYAQKPPLAAQIAAPSDSTVLWWLGHNCWLIRSGDLLIGVDLVLQDSYRIVPGPLSAGELAPHLDVLFITHGHDDHFNKYTARILLERSSCLFVLPASCLAIAHELGIPDERIRVARPREPFHLMGMEITPLRAIHGNANFAIYYEANLDDCGYHIALNGLTLLQPGDSYLLEDHLFLKHVDVLFFSPTEHNMYIDPSVILINALEPDFIFPQHHGTMKYGERDRFWAKGYPSEVKIRLPKFLQDCYHVLEIGERRNLAPVP
jgi:L-ascorbate 6-phosphate lactonase